MNSQQAHRAAAASARDRGRARLRAVTVAVGAAGLAVGGAVAYVLPGSSHASTASGTTSSGSTGSASSSGSSGSSGSASSSGSSGGSASSGSSQLGIVQRLRDLLRAGFQRPDHVRRILMPAAPDAGADGPEAAATWRAIGTSVHLIVTGLRALAPARRMLTEDLAALDAACSRFRADSEIVALDHAPQRAGGRTGPVPVSPLLAGALAVALRAARLTGGDVDPTVCGAIRAAGYDRDFALVRKDGPPVKLTVCSVPGWREIDLDEEAGLVSLPAGTGLGGRPGRGADRRRTRLRRPRQPGR